MGTVLGLLVILAIIGVVVAGISRSIGSSQHETARTQSSGRSLSDLQAGAPEWKAQASITSKTVFGNKATGWFESLLERSYSNPDELAGALPFLRIAYTQGLEAFARFLRATLTVWKDDPSETATFVLGQADAWAVVAIQGTAEWLKKVATRHNELAAAANLADRWNVEILNARSATVMSSLPLAPVTYNVEVRCTPAALDAEIARLRVAGLGPT